MRELYSPSSLPVLGGQSTSSYLSVDKERKNKNVKLCLRYMSQVTCMYVHVVAPKCVH